MTQLVDLLGHPERAFPSIHLTGTNGKTSTARMIDSLLPRLRAPARALHVAAPGVGDRAHRDRRAAGRPPEVLGRAYDDVLPYVELVDAQSPEPVTYFELMTAMAFSAFADAPVDIGVIEVGMGGTWDATNVIDGAVQVVTPVSLDHPELGRRWPRSPARSPASCGPTPSAILGQQAAEAAEVLLRRASELGHHRRAGGHRVRGRRTGRSRSAGRC